jgi:hypothetical protein
MSTQPVDFNMCIKCFGQGELDNPNRLPKARAQRICDYCMGRKVVPLVTCRGCGRPALHYNDPRVSYCGRAECMGRLVEEIDPNAEPPREMRVIHGPGFSPFPVVDRRRFMNNSLLPIEERAKRCGMSVAEFVRWLHY